MEPLYVPTTGRSLPDPPPPLPGRQPLRPAAGRNLRRSTTAWYPVGRFSRAGSCGRSRPRERPS